MVTISTVLNLITIGKVEMQYCGSKRITSGMRPYLKSDGKS